MRWLILSNRKVVSLEERIPKLKQRRKQKANRRLILYLSIFFLLILGVIYFQSPLSKISAIKISGNQFIPQNEMIQLSKLAVGTSFWNFSSEEVEKNILQHPEIKKVSVKRVFPNIVTIEVKEYKRIAYILTNDKYLPIIENGEVLKTEHKDEIILNAPVFVNWSKGEDIQEMIAQFKELPESVMNSISEIHFTPIPTDSLHITLFMNDGNQVIASIRNFSEKMKYYPAMVKELDPNVKGIFYIDVENRFIPFGDDKNESER